MQILLGLIVGACIGVALHFAVPGRSTRGVALAPILGTFVAPAAVVWPTLVVLKRIRDAHDERERERLRIA